MKRTSQDPIEHIEDIQDLDQMIVDKRSVKRSTSVKGRRRNRRYENRLLNAQVRDSIAIEDED